MASDHDVPADCAVGLECQAVWCKLILSGQKLEETRRYALPTELLGRRIWLLASSGQAGAPALSDEVPNHSQDASIVGWVVFSSMHHYTDKAAWVAGRTRHLVDDEGPYGWLDGDGVGVYGWEISDKATLPRTLPMVAAKTWQCEDPISSNVLDTLPQISNTSVARRADAIICYRLLFLYL